MKTLELAAAAALVLLTGCAQPHPKTTMDTLEGTWTCVSAVIDGRPLADDTVRLLRLTLTTNRYTTLKGTLVLFDSTYTADLAKHPHEINILGTEGALKGKEARGIYDLAGDTLMLCYTMPGKQRPTAFESPAGSEAYLMSWKRQALPGR